MSLSPEQMASPRLAHVLAQLKGVRTSLRGWRACCPAHADSEPSLSIGLGEQGQVLLKCFAGCSLERIVEAIGLTILDLFPAGATTAAQASSNGTHQKILTLLDLAVAKQLPWKYLLHLGVMDHAPGGVQVPYHLVDGQVAPRYRIRTALVAREGSRWNSGEGNIVPYGLGRLEDARKAGYLVLVEGESDCWTLWYQGFPALGIPGADMISVLEAAMLSGIDRLYLLQEPDQGGSTFVSHLTKRLTEWRWPGQALVVRLCGAKDPSDLYIQDRKGFRAAFQHALEHAAPLAFNHSHAVAPPIEAQPKIFSLRELLSWDLPPTRWAIPEILPEGLTLLAGKPKQGKSWLALSAALSIASGGVALGTQPVSQGEVLYLALEDNARRLQGRARQLLASMTGVPDGMDFALHWPRLGDGGLALLEEHIKAHPSLRLIVIDTWARVAPPAGKRHASQYEGDYEALIPLKHLADTYRVSILAVHHLRKTGSSDVLDEITGSIGMTGAVDGTLILKRERGQAEATLFVTGRDIEHEQHLALSFDAATALWTVIGSAEEVGRSRERRQILNLLAEQSEGMSPREVAKALEKNYHTTRSLLRKMEEAGEVTRLHGKYLALEGEQRRESAMFTQEDAPVRQEAECHQRTAGHEDTNNYANASRSDDGDGDDADYTDYADVRNHIAAVPVDYADDSDYDYNTAADSPTQGHAPDMGAALQEGIALIPHGVLVLPQQQDGQHQEPAIISVINRNQRNQSPGSPPSMEKETFLSEAEQDTTGENKGAFARRDRCPHHPRARLVRFDPAGQAWCDHLDCWCCYRLMKIGEALAYRYLTERGGQFLIEEGIEAWSTYVRTQQAFPVAWATQEALALCFVLGIREPDLSGEVKRLSEVPSLPP